MPAGLSVLLVALLLAATAFFGSHTASNKKYYEVLGIPEDADDRLIKKAYKKQALKWHPDRHTSDKKKAEERFKEIAAAYETLSDPEKRRIYDQFGEEGLKQGGPGGPGGPGGGFQFHGDPFEMFNMFFGGGGQAGAGGSRQFHFSTGGGGGGGGGGFQFQGGFPGGGFPGGGGGGMGGGGFPGGQRGGGGHASGGGLYSEDDAVLQLDADSFPSSSSGWVWLVEFYSPWCGHCQQLAPKWKQVASSLKGVVKVAAINCDEHKSICSAQGVRGYPTIMALAPGSSRWQEYQGDRGAASIGNWATSLIANAATTLTKEAHLQSLLSQCGGRAGGKGAKRGSSASWSVCLLLVSRKPTVPSLWKALSQVYQGKAAFGFVSSESSAVLSQLGAAAELGGAKSKVVAICNGDVRTAEAYTGTTKSEPLQRFISSYASGKKCASQVVLDESTDLAALKVAQLKALVTAKGVDCSGCFEKADYVAVLKGWLAQQKASAAESKGEL